MTVNGTRFFYRVDPKAPDADERERLRAEFQRTRDAMRAADDARAKRLAEVLAADAEYQRLKAAHAEAKRAHEAVPASHRYRISVGRDHQFFISTVAEGDNWSEVVDKVCNSGGTR